MQKLVYGAIGLVGLLILGGLFLPSTHRVQTQIEIDAPPATVFALVSDWPRIAAWAPWGEQDGKLTFNSGAERSATELSGMNSAVIGSSTHVIERRTEYTHVGIVIDPGAASESRSWFDLQPGVGTTIVTWSFETDHGYNLVGRYFASAIGGVVANEYQEGLARLKDLAESLPSADFGNLAIETMTVKATDIVYITGNASPEPDAIAAAMGRAYFRVLRYMDQNGLATAGSPLLVLRDYSGAQQVFDAAIPFDGSAPAALDSDAAIKIGQTYAGPVVRASHRGAYANLRETHRKISAYLAAKGIERNGPAWESYITDPADVVASDLLTHVFYPVKADADRPEVLP